MTSSASRPRLCLPGPGLQLCATWGCGSMHLPAVARPPVSSFEAHQQSCPGSSEFDHLLLVHQTPQGAPLPPGQHPSSSGGLEAPETCQVRSAPSLRLPVPSPHSPVPLLRLAHLARCSAPSLPSSAHLSPLSSLCGATALSSCRDQSLHHIGCSDWHTNPFLLLTKTT